MTWKTKQAAKSVMCEVGGLGLYSTAENRVSIQKFYWLVPCVFLT